MTNSLFVSLFSLFLTTGAQSGTVRHKVFALTFDDGPKVKVTIPLLRTLNKYKIKTVFFVNASGFRWRRRKYKKRVSILKKAVKEGHLIGNHTHSHFTMSKLSWKKQIWEMKINDYFLKKLVGVTAKYYRPPSGVMTKAAYWYMKKHSYTRNVLWNVSVEDYKWTNPYVLFKRLRKKVIRRSNGVILMHDIYKSSYDAVRVFLRYVHRRNCKNIKNKKPLYHFLRIDRYDEYQKSKGNKRKLWNTKLLQKQNSLCSKVLRKP